MLETGKVEFLSPLLPVAYLGFQKGEAKKFSLATSALQRGGQTMFSYCFLW